MIKLVISDYETKSTKSLNSAEVTMGVIYNVLWFLVFFPLICILPLFSANYKVFIDSNMIINRFINLLLFI